MSGMIRKAFPNPRLGLRMGCGEQLLLSDSLAFDETRHSDLERSDMKLPGKAKPQRRRGE